MKKYKKTKHIFSNIAEGTHAGAITFKAAEDIDKSHLLVCLDESGCAVNICGATEMPVGVCTDECDINDDVAVALVGSASSTLLCRCAADIDAGQAVYSAAGGMVTDTPSGACYKIGVALSSALEGGLVEVDPHGFGTRALQIADGGIHAWAGATATEDAVCAAAEEGDIVIATLAAAASTETLVSAVADDGKITFTLSAAGTASTTKIQWIIIKK